MIKRSLEEVSGYNLYSKNAIPNNKTVDLNKNAKIHFIILLELQWLQKYKYATAGHVNPKKTSYWKNRDRVPPQPMLWRRLWGYKANLKLQQIKAVITCIENGKINANKSM